MQSWMIPFRLHWTALLSSRSKTCRRISILTLILIVFLTIIVLSRESMTMVTAYQSTILQQQNVKVKQTKSGISPLAFKIKPDFVRPIRTRRWTDKENRDLQFQRVPFEKNLFQQQSQLQSQSHHYHNNNVRPIMEVVSDTVYQQKMQQSAGTLDNTYLPRMLLHVPNSDTMNHAIRQNYQVPNYPQVNQNQQFQYQNSFHIDQRETSQQYNHNLLPEGSPSTFVSGASQPSAQKQIPYQQEFRVEGLYDPNVGILQRNEIQLHPPPNSGFEFSRIGDENFEMSFMKRNQNQQFQYHQNQHLRPPGPGVQTLHLNQQHQQRLKQNIPNRPINQHLRLNQHIRGRGLRKFYALQLNPSIDPRNQAPFHRQQYFQHMPKHQQLQLASPSNNYHSITPNLQIHNPGNMYLKTRFTNSQKFHQNAYISQQQTPSFHKKITPTVHQSQQRLEIKQQIRVHPEQELLLTQSFSSYPKVWVRPPQQSQGISNNNALENNQRRLDIMRQELRGPIHQSSLSLASAAIGTVLSSIWEILETLIGSISLFLYVLYQVITSPFISDR